MVVGNKYLNLSLNLSLSLSLSLNLNLYKVLPINDKYFIYIKV